jgi:2-dehydro-3-deoxygluconokinase
MIKLNLKPFILKTVLEMHRFISYRGKTMNVVTFGEIMLRLAPEGYLRFEQSTKYEASFGGGEANVAVSLAQFGHTSYFVSKLPKHAIGEAALRSLRQEGVNTQYIVRGGDRMGIYFLEKGASQRASQVIYDRADSAIALATENDFDFDQIFEGKDWFHITGITLALNPMLAEMSIHAAKLAKSKGLKVSCDLNYRKKLWTKEAAQEAMSQLMPYVDVLIANEEDAENVFGIKAKDTEVSVGHMNTDAYVDVAKQLKDRFNIPHIAITLRTSLSADDNKWSAMLYTLDTAYFAPTYALHIVDRVGGGDSFAAGLIHAYANEMDPQNALNFATAASALKHSIVGDFNHVSEQEVLTLMKGDGSGRVVR